MVVIHFQNQEEVDYLYMLLKKHQSDGIQLTKGSLQLTVDIDDSNMEYGYSVLHVALKKLILEKKRNDWWISILEEEFFYTDLDEQLHILDMVHSIIAGKRNDLTVEIDHAADERQIDEAISDLLQTSQSFSLEAFITFRLRFYMEKLVTYIELAIDEYKLEQDYQMFIHYLRDFIKDRKAQMDCVYLVNNEGFIFFDENKQEIKRSELNKRIDRKLLTHHPIYVDSTTIAPLLSIAPNKIYLYTNEPEQGIIQTIKQVFEEKLEIEPLSNFSSYSTNFPIQ
ncbi:putative sporulation protein YtxC [Caldibacillus lycopersici]|uniref:Sporulation protein YtxC n=1 Tax=Perspicuibacillus lycopersici TaxID=1325689 RepID=A0AAE3IT61_9BACI|nr:putative sporulation protein YtxC [Perspicuibacillus lycopersici]MCU9614168.1 putative sporulation protein YtxC [Perspicuibacillus lycopersici]